MNKERVQEIKLNIAKNGKEAVLPGSMFEAELTLDEVGDTYLDMSNWKKGFVWVNGYNLGRYWSVGPQQRLYCPGVWLNQGYNLIVIFDLYLTEPAYISGKTTLK